MMKLVTDDYFYHLTVVVHEWLRAILQGGLGFSVLCFPLLFIPSSSPPPPINVWSPPGIEPRTACLTHKQAVQG